MGSNSEGEKYCLRWNEFSSNLSNAFNELRNDEDFFDITLITEESEIRCHKLILGACSPHFKQIIKRLQSVQNPAIYLRGVRHEDIKNVLEFMYLGVVNVSQDDLDSFLAVAQDLCIKGLTQDNDQPTPSTSSHSNSKPFQQGIKRKYDSSTPKSSPAKSLSASNTPKKEPKIEPDVDVIIDDPENEIQETYDDYGDYETAGPSGEGVTDETKGFLGTVDIDEDALLEELSDEPSGKVLCKICGKTYSKKTNGRRHIKDAHVEHQQVECQICHKRYRNRRYRNDHYRTAHKIQISQMPALI